MNLGGYAVRIAPSYQKHWLSEDVTVTDKFREEFNLYLLDLFGKEEVVKDNAVLEDVSNKILYVNKKTFERLKHELDSGNLQSALRPVNAPYNPFVNQSFGLRMRDQADLMMGVSY